MKTKSTIKERETNLEQILNNQVEITFKDKWDSFKVVSKKNSGKLASFISGVLLTGVCAGSVYGLFQEIPKTEKYNQAYHYFMGMKKQVEAINEYKTGNPFSKNAMQIPYELIEENSKQTYPEKGKNTLNYIQDNRKYFEEEYNSEKALEIIKELEDQSKSLASTGLEITYTLGTILGGMGGIFLGIIGGIELFSSWRPDRCLADKQKHNEKIDSEIETLRDYLKNNTNQEQFYDFAERIIEKKQDIGHESLIEILHYMANKQDKKYGPFFEMMNLEYNQVSDYYYLHNRFKNYEERLEEKSTS